MDKEREMHLLLSQVIRLYQTRTFALCEGLGVHPGQIPLLFTLQRRDGVSQRELVGALFVRPPTVTVMIRRMAHSGLIERRIDPEDRRVTHIYLTERGRDVIKQLMETVHSVAADAFEGFTQEELDTLRGLFQKLKGNLMRAEQDTGEGEAAL